MKSMKATAAKEMAIRNSSSTAPFWVESGNH